MRNPTVVTDRRALEVFAVQPRGLRAAIARAMLNEEREFAESRWNDALSSSSNAISGGDRAFGSRVVDSRTATVKASAADAFAPIQRIGGRQGWYYGNWLWHVRGFFDLMAGGIGVRRGRRHPVHLQVGDALDFWRVERFEQDRLLRLAAEMKVPGRAWLEFDVDHDPGTGKSTIRQTAIFDPHGLTGLAYWYGLYPLHHLVFSGMLRNIAQCAEQRATGQAPPD
jgi:hypothetical protein